MKKGIKFGVVLLGSLLSCNFETTYPHIAVFSTVDALMRTDNTRTGFFTNASLFDKKYNTIEYITTQGKVIVPNDGTQNCLMCRYDTDSHEPIWIAVGGGKGGDGGCNYYTVPPENAVYVVGYFEDTAYFPIKAGSRNYKEIISNGMADMFVAKYSYDNGTLQWISSGGSPYADIVYTDNLGARHQETLMAVDSTVVTVCTNFFGPSKFDDKTIDAKLSGSAIQISYDKSTGQIKDAGFVTALPLNIKH